ncbi:MAG: peptidoglycan DD-metalloendopeptidase family protein [Candidatus Fermentibacteraceae bacterium]
MFLLALPLLAAAAGASGLDSLNARLEETQASIEELEEREAGARDLLLAIHEHLTTAREYYNSLADREAGLSGLLSRAEDSCARYDSLRSDLVEALGGYLRFLYSHRRYSRSALLLAPDGVNRMLRRRAYLDFLAQRAMERVDRLTVAADSLHRYRDSLEVLRSSVHDLRLQMETVHERICRQEERQALYRQELSAEIAAAEARAREMEEERRRRSALVARLQESSEETETGPMLEPTGDSYFQLNRGGIQWPCRGEVVRTFGVRADPVYGTETVSDGIQVSTAPGQTVRLPAPGRVMYADDFLSLGRMVVVDHRDGYYSVYGHLGELDIEVDVELEQGGSIGTCGTLPSGRAGYYFEIRRGGDPVDPLNYLSGE